MLARRSDVMLSRATPTRTTARNAGRDDEARRIDLDARRITAVIHASCKLQRLRNRIAALELARARVEHKSGAT